MVIFLPSCQSPSIHKDETLVRTDGVLTLVQQNVESLPNWHQDNFETALVPVQRSCQKMLKQDPDKVLFNKAGVVTQNKHYQPFCKAVIQEKDPGNLKQHIQEHFNVYLVKEGERDKGLFTGYYEPALHGSLRPSKKYRTPLYSLPSNRLRKHSRGSIVRGILKNKDLELVWVDDPIDAFFIQVQGSGRVILDTGEVVRLQYAGQNGFPYVAIGKVLVDRKEIDAKDISLHSIKNWLRSNPHQAEAIMSQNPSYVFFRKNRAQKKKADPIYDGPLGAQGVPLTTGRSLAVDNRYIPYGSMVWVDLQHPMGKDNLQHLMVVQDTGGAIRGPVRGDYFWGFGKAAEYPAGLMKSVGRYFLFLPKK